VNKTSWLWGYRVEKFSRKLGRFSLPNRLAKRSRFRRLGWHVLRFGVSSGVSVNRFVFGQHA
jgi:hypothetical protein